MMDDRIIDILESFENEKKYWVGKLHGRVEAVQFPADFKNSLEYIGKEYKLVFEKDFFVELFTVCNENDLSLYVILLAAFKVLILKYTEQEDIIVASPMHTKDKYRANDFIPLRDFLANEMTFREVLMNLKKTVSEGYKHQHYPIKKIFDSPGKSSRFELLSNIVMILENIHRRDTHEDLLLSTKNEMTISFTRREEGLHGIIIYDGQLFRESSIQRIAVCYIRILRWVLANIDTALNESTLLTEEERRELLYSFNDTYMEDTGSKTIQELFSDRVEKTPANIAVIFKNHRLSFEILNAQSNRLARILRTKGVTPDTIVGLILDNSLEMVVGILGVLKAGGFYLPLEPITPPNRLCSILDECRASIVLTQSQVIEKETFSFLKSFDIMLLDRSDDILAKESIEDLESLYRLTDLAYCIFTSGTTGKSKGVLVEQKSIINYILWRLHTYGYREEDVTLQLLSYAFDGFYSNLYSALLSGGSLVMIPDFRKEGMPEVNEIIRENKVTNMSLVPAIYRALLESADQQVMKSIRFVVLGGEDAGAQLVKLSKEKNPGIQLINEYGPTETAVAVAVNLSMDETNTSIIGKPIANTSIYVLDKRLNPVYYGIPGELYAAGKGAARGYLNNTDLTTRKFIESPFKPGERLYKTGDLARWLPDGNIEFIGRVDNQVKIRGYRIEPEEIAVKLSKNDEIEDALVTAIEPVPGEKCLCAYIVSKKKFSLPVLHEYLSGDFPNYMMPSYIMQLEEIPLTQSGKVDWKSLPIPTHQGVKTDGIYATPENEIENKLAIIWSEILGIERNLIGIDANFFEIGGHSLKATVMTAKIHKEFDVKLPLVEVFKALTIRKLAKYITNAVENRYSFIEMAEEKEYYPLSSVQRRLYFLYRFETDSTTYNTPLLLAIEGKLEYDGLKNIFNRLVMRYESLRTSFLIVNEDQPVQKIHKSRHIAFEITYYLSECSSRGSGHQKQDPKSEELNFETDASQAGTIIERFIRPFDLSQAPLMRVGLIKLDDEKHILIVDMHHIITDGVSNDILEKEFVALYNGKERQPLKLQYKDYSEWENSTKGREVHKQQEDFWLREFSGKIPVLALPLDYKRPTFKKHQGGNIYFSINQGTTKQLNELTRETGATLYMVSLAVYNILLFKYSKQHVIVVGSPVTGRAHADLQDIVGMFVNMLAIKNSPGGSQTFREFLGKVKEKVLDAFDNQAFQYEELVSKLRLQGDTGRNPLFDVVLAMQNVNITKMDNISQVKSGLKISPYKQYEQKIAKFDLLINIIEANGSLDLILEYSTELFRKSTAERISRNFVEIIEQVLKNPDIKLMDIRLSSELVAITSNAFLKDQEDFLF